MSKAPAAPQAKQAGWQVYYIADDKIVGCLSATLLMAQQLKNVGTFPHSKAYIKQVARDLLQGPHPLDHLGRIRISVVYFDPNSRD